MFGSMVSKKLNPRGTLQGKKERKKERRKALEKGRHQQKNLPRVLSNAGYDSVCIRTLLSAVIEVLHDHSFAPRIATLQENHDLVLLQKLHHRALNNRGKSYSDTNRDGEDDARRTRTGRERKGPLETASPPQNTRSRTLNFTPGRVSTLCGVSSVRNFIIHKAVCWILRKIKNQSFYRFEVRCPAQRFFRRRYIFLRRKILLKFSFYSKKIFKIEKKIL